MWTEINRSELYSLSLQNNDSDVWYILYHYKHVFAISEEWLEIFKGITRSWRNWWEMHEWNVFEMLLRHLKLRGDACDCWFYFFWREKYEKQEIFNFHSIFCHCCLGEKLRYWRDRISDLFSYGDGLWRICLKES